jgi:hypothetical protein
MKKNVRRLRLSRETLRILQGDDVKVVAGGTNSFPTSCECFIATGCECASQGGTDCYPPSACFGTCSC